MTFGISASAQSYNAGWNEFTFDLGYGKTYYTGSGNSSDEDIYGLAFNYARGISYYQSTEGWKDFWNFNGGAENYDTGISNITIDNETKPAVIYDLNGRKLSKPKHGLNIINGKKVVVK